MASSSSSRYEALSDRGLVDLQKQIMQAQDNHLDEMEKSVGNLKEASIAMSQEITVQNALLDDMNTRVDGTRERMTNVRERVSWFRARPGTCKLWLIVICLIILIILVLAYL